MSNLINVNQSGKTTSKELYEFLELNPSQYSRWAKANIEDNQFAEVNKDYEVLDINVENSQGGRPSQNYRLSIDFAKKLCMVSKSEKGEQARNYFIEVEKQYLVNATPIKLTPQPKYRARMISTAVKDVDATAKQMMKLFGVKDGIAYAAAINMVENVYRIDMSPVKKLLPSAKHEIGRLNASEIADKLNIRYKTGSPDPKTINKMLITAGLMEKSNDSKQPYILTDSGKELGEFVPYTRGGHSGYEIRWNPAMISMLVSNQLTAKEE